jgi:hypothetical protein
MASTTGIEVGMQVTGTNSPLTTITSVDLNGTDDWVYLASHGLIDGDEVAFTLISGTTGIVADKIYYVAGTIASNSFQLTRPMAGTSPSPLVFRQLKTGTALLKGWTVTG